MYYKIKFNSIQFNSRRIYICRVYMAYMVKLGQLRVNMTK